MPAWFDNFVPICRRGGKRLVERLRAAFVVAETNAVRRRLLTGIVTGIVTPGTGIATNAAQVSPEIVAALADDLEDITYFFEFCGNIRESIVTADRKKLSVQDFIAEVSADANADRESALPHLSTIVEDVYALSHIRLTDITPEILAVLRDGSGEPLISEEKKEFILKGAARFKAMGFESLTEIQNGIGNMAFRTLKFYAESADRIIDTGGYEDTMQSTMALARISNELSHQPLFEDAISTLYDSLESACVNAEAASKRWRVGRNREGERLASQNNRLAESAPVETSSPEPLITCYVTRVPAPKNAQISRIRRKRPNHALQTNR